MNIIWEDYLWEGENLANEADIKLVENTIKEKFPNDYLKIVKKHQGQTPSPQIFSLGSGFITSISVLFHYSEDENTYNILSSYENTREHIPNKVIPIADTPGGDHICFDYRTERDMPTVVFVAHELTGNEAVLFIANSFTEFLNMLHEDESENG